MEAFEHVVKVYLEANGYVVTSGVKFPIKRVITKKSGRQEAQTHGYEVNLIAVRNKSLILGSVKSFFGSAGVHRQGFVGLADKLKRTHYDRYTMFNVPEVRDGLIRGAAERYGYNRSQIRLGLYVGKFHTGDESVIRTHLQNLKIPVEVIGLEEMVKTLLELAEHKTYINDPVLVTLKVLMAAGAIKEKAAERKLKIRS